jgi:hypothetical protein
MFVSPYDASSDEAGVGLGWSKYGRFVGVRVEG